MRIPTGIIDRYVYFVAVDATDLKTRETGLSSFTVYGSKNGAAAAAFTTPTVNETDASNMPGVYELLLDEQTSLDAGDDTQELCLHITHAGMAAVTRVVEIYRPETTEGNTLDVTAGGAGGIDWGNIENKATTNDLSATDIQLADTVTTLTGHVKQTGDNYARIGAPAGASVSADVAAVKVDTTAIALDTDELQSDNVPGLIAALNDLSAAEVNAEVLDVMDTDTITEPGQAAPPAVSAATMKDVLLYLYIHWHNKIETNDTEMKIYGDNESTILMKAPLDDDATTATKGEVITGA